MLKQVLKNAYRLFQFIKWLLLGKPVPPNSYVKQYLIRNAFFKSNSKVFIETGTLHGRTLEVIAPLAEQAYSIELDKKYFDRALIKFEKVQNVTLLNGDSGVLIHEVLKKLKEPAFFWLDAHYSGGSTSQGNKDTPISEELSAILQHPIKGHTIWIDDARCFDGTHDYPTLKHLEKNIGLSMIVKNDIIQIG
ncbi:MAG: hypothetical protein HKP14_01415 [Bacteroidia bacterium]|nr:hypothetical protein [Bacteroidia bacterium]